MVTTLTLKETAPALRETAVHFIAGMPGLEEYADFTLIGIDDAPVYWLQCMAEPEIALPVAVAAVVEPSFAFELSTADAKALALESAEDALVLIVLTVPRGAGEITANLFAPVVVNRNSMRAKQVILEGTRYSLRHPIETL